MAGKTSQPKENPEEYINLSNIDLNTFSLEREMNPMLLTPLEVNAKATHATMLHNEQHNLTKSANQKGKQLESNKEPLKIPWRFAQWAKIFNKKASKQFPPSRTFDHKIELKPTFEAKSMKLYQVAPAEEKALKEFIDKNLQKGYIHPSKSPMASPFFFVAKKGGDL